MGKSFSFGQNKNYIENTTVNFNNFKYIEIKNNKK